MEHPDPADPLHCLEVAPGQGREERAVTSRTGELPACFEQTVEALQREVAIGETSHGRQEALNEANHNKEKPKLR